MQCFPVSSDQEDIEFAGPYGFLLFQGDIRSGNGDAKGVSLCIGEHLCADCNFARIRRLPHRLRKSLLHGGGFLVVLIARAEAKRSVVVTNKFYGQAVVLSVSLLTRR